MTRETLKNIKEETVSEEVCVDKVTFISTEEEEQEGNFEFLCCRGGMSPGGGGIGGRW